MFLTCTALVALLVAGQTEAGSLQERVQALLHAPGYEHARWGLLVVDAKSGEILYEQAADQLFRPASVTKLFSTAAALAALGADHRFETPIVRRGEVDTEGVLQGDLILVAQGDPSLGGRTGPDGSLLFQDNDHTYAGPQSRSKLVAADPVAGLDHLAREVLASGIKAVTGEILVDDRLFVHTTSTGSGPRRVSPIIVNDNLIDVVITPAETQGAPASVSLVPQTAYAAFDAQVETTPADSRKNIVIAPVGPRRFTVRGQIPAGSSPSIHIYEVDDPASFARALLIEALRRRGVVVSASPLAENPGRELPSREEVARLPQVAKYTSPPLREYLRVILKVSHNLHASLLPMLLAVQAGERTLDAGLARQGELLKSIGVDPATVSFGGGAGGSSADLVTPRAAVTLLQAMATRPDFTAYEAALPVLGRDGTLANSVPSDSAARGHARAKTGTYYVTNSLNQSTVLTSKALAGYLETASGRDLTFAFFLNDIPLPTPNGDVSEATAEVGRLLGRLCEVFYNHTPPALDTTQHTNAHAEPAHEPDHPTEGPTGRPPDHRNAPSP